MNTEDEAMKAAEDEAMKAAEETTGFGALMTMYGARAAAKVGLLVAAEAEAEKTTREAVASDLESLPAKTEKAEKAWDAWMEAREAARTANRMVTWATEMRADMKKMFSPANLKAARAREAGRRKHEK